MSSTLLRVGSQQSTGIYTILRNIVAVGAQDSSGCCKVLQPRKSVMDSPSRLQHTWNSSSQCQQFHSENPLGHSRGSALVITSQPNFEARQARQGLPCDCLDQYPFTHNIPTLQVVRCQPTSSFQVTEMRVEALSRSVEKVASHGHRELHFYKMRQKSSLCDVKDEHVREDAKNKKIKIKLKNEDYQRACLQGT